MHILLTINLHFLSVCLSLPNVRIICDNCLKFNASFEEFAPLFNYNSQGKLVIGYGHYCPEDGLCDGLQQPMNKEKAEELLLHDLRPAEDSINKNLPPPTQD